MLFIIGMTIAIGLVLNKLLRSIGYKKRLMVIGFLILGVVAEYNFPMKFQQVPQKNDFPQVYHWLAAAVPEDTAVIIMPAYNWNMKHSEDEIMRQYYSTIHFRRTVNGYSGFSPPAWQDFLIELAENFPSQSSLDKLKNIGVRYIIVDKDGYDKSFSEGYLQVDGSTIIDLLSKNGQINFVGVKDNYFIFQFEKSTNPGIDVNQKIPLD
jgi:hypothetical protein